MLGSFVERLPMSIPKISTYVPGSTFNIFEVRSWCQLWCWEIIYIYIYITIWLFDIAMENHFLIGKPSINGPLSMAMLNNQRDPRGYHFCWRCLPSKQHNLGDWTNKTMQRSKFSPKTHRFVHANASSSIRGVPTDPTVPQCQPSGPPSLPSPRCGAGGAAQWLSGSAAGLEPAPGLSCRLRRKELQPSLKKARYGGGRREGGKEGSNSDKT